MGESKTVVKCLHNVLALTTVLLSPIDMSKSLASAVRLAEFMSKHLAIRV